MTINKIIIGLIVVVIIAVGAYFVMKRDKISSPEIAEAKLRVGVVVPLTGPGAFPGEELKNGMELALKELKDASLEVYFEDSQTNPAQGVNAYKKLKQTKDIDLVVVAFSAVAAAVTPPAIDDKVVVLQTLVSAPNIAAQSPYTFRYFSTADQDAGISADVAAKKINAKTAAVIHLQDEYGVSYFTAFKNQLEKHGGKVVLEETFTRTDNDFRPQLTKIKNLNPDVIYVVALDQGTVTILKQIKELNIKSKVFSSWILASPATRALAAEYGNGVYTNAANFYLQDSGPRAKEFAGKYETTFQKKPQSAYSPIGYDIVNLLTKIQKEPGDTSEDIIRKFTDIQSMEGIMGSLQINDVGEISFPLYPVVIENQNLTPLGNE